MCGGVRGEGEATYTSPVSSSMMTKAKSPSSLEATSTPTLSYRWMMGSQSPSVLKLTFLRPARSSLWL